MPSTNRQFAIGSVYHIYSRGNNKSTLFLDNEDYHVFAQMVNEGLRRYELDIHHFALMPNHFHFLLTLRSIDLDKFMHYIKLQYSKYFDRRYERIGHIWQGRYKCKMIETDRYLQACGEYIEMNPVRAGLVRDPADWPFSSYRSNTFQETSIIRLH